MKIIRSLTLAIALLITAPIAAQTTAPTIATTKAEMAKKSGKPEPKTWAQWWTAWKAIPNYVAPPPRDPWDEAFALNAPDVYVLSTATSFRVQAWVTNQYKEPATRSFSVYAAPGNGDGFGLGYYEYPANRTATFFPSNGSRMEWTMQLNEPRRGRVGRFPFFIQSTEGLGQRSIWINIVDAYPAGYTPPASFGPLPTPRLTLPARAPDLGGDFIKDWTDWTTDSFSINLMKGWFVTEGVTTTRSGAKPNPYQIDIIDGRPTRVLRPVDVRNDPIDSPDGEKLWAMGFVKRTMPAVSGIMQVTADFGPSTSPSTPNDVIATDNAWWSWTPERPVEQDNHEQFSAAGDSNGYNRFPIVTYHENSGNQLEMVRQRKISFAPFGDKLGKHTLTRVRSVERNVTDYYVDGVRVIEAQNIGLLKTWFEAFSGEGPGGTVAGTYNPAQDYSRSTITLYDWKWWTLKPTDPVR